jgi:hypothetical protein
MESKETWGHDSLLGITPENEPPRHAGSLILLKDAAEQLVHADTDTHASSASSRDTDRIAALSQIDAVYGMRPKYLRYNLWSSEEDANFGNTAAPPCLADWTETAKPLPSVPMKELANIHAMSTIRDHPHLFSIITPINVDRFEELLETHPNRPFIESVCRGLREGFWPWADTHYEMYPIIVDEALGMPKKEEETDFLRKQRDHERAKGRFSGSFDQDLLPGMHVSPIHMVPKPHTDKLRMVINQSAGQYSPNSMIK